MNYLDHNTLTAIAAVIMAIVALFGVTVGPIVSWKIAKRQIATTLRSTSRKQWLDTLRDEVAEFVGLLTGGGSMIKAGEIASSGIGELGGSLHRKLAKIELLLNPKEDLHNQLVWFLREVCEILNPALPQDAEKFRENIDKALETCKEIIKTEWDNIEEGK